MQQTLSPEGDWKRPCIHLDWVQLHVTENPKWWCLIQESCYFFSLLEEVRTPWEGSSVIVRHPACAFALNHHPWSDVPLL